ncbi:unnamed protein product [Mytilus edulis]|uniref:OTU domain-containing protein n=1 Tax=Mytilus edulis TaxID=6550 RepID=A0A8S3RLW4_MYTED|nr:unnamed protein product [Mytilus edulis]
MKIAEQESLSEYRKRHDINRNHSKRLDVLLKSNALCRQHVPAVGNCFFEAVSRQTTEKIDAITLRQLLCNHIEENANYYGEFLNSAEDNLCNEIELLRQEDSWQNNLSDTMPLAIANLLAVTVKIYSSNPDQPVVVITPSLTETYEKQEITLAYLCGLQLESENELEICDDLDCQPSTADITIEYSNENTSGTPSKVQNPLRDDEIITPRKQAKYQSPKKRRLTRKKIANPESWKKNIRKIKCQSGMEYVSDTGKTVKARSIKKHACSKCRFRCADKLSEDERLALFNNYWNLKSYERQRDYISSRVLERNSIGSPSKKRSRSKTIPVLFPIKEENTVHNRTPTEDLNIIRAHIEAFPVVESHYTRKDTNRKYLDSDLTIRKMYDLYKDECHDQQKRCVKEHVYRNIFCSEYNMSFHKPKKDQCLICHNYNTMIETGNTDEAVKRIYTEHQQRKVRGREEKQIDKEIAKKDKSYQAVTFDLEAVLPTPCSLVSQVYYKRKLSCYNLSFYSLGDNKGTCYLWNETEGERGSCEVASCLHKYITSLPPYVRHISFYSDNCMGQNRNKFVAAALLYSVKVNKHINIIDQKYLETGHTHMECDSMHAAIEHAKRKTNIYIPSQWDTVIHMARRNNPYVVIPLKYWDILDFKSLQKENYKNMEQNKKGEKVRWREIKQLQFRKETPNIIYYKYSFREEFNEIACKVVTRGRQKLVDNLAVSSKYKERLPITEAKKADLLSLCQSGIIPADCVQFYKSLPTKKGKKDRLPEPDVEEQDQDSD